MTFIIFELYFRGFQAESLVIWCSAMSIQDNICSCKNGTFWDDGVLSISACTQDIVSVSLPLAVLILAFPALILKIVRKSADKGVTAKKWTLVNNLRLCFTIITLLLAALFRLLLCLDNEWCSLDLVLLVFSLLNIVFTAGNLLAVISLRSSSSKTQFFFWLVSAVCNISCLIEGIQDLESVGDYKFILPFVIEVFCLLLLISQWLPYASVQPAEEGSSFPDNLVFFKTILEYI